MQRAYSRAPSDASAPVCSPPTRPPTCCLCGADRETGSPEEVRPQPRIRPNALIDGSCFAATPPPSAAMEETRSTWQMWHVRAEAQRHLRTVDVPAEHAATLVNLLVDKVLDRRCVALAAQADGIEEPGVLRRPDGSSVYSIAGADLYTSQRILDAEQRLVTVAGIRDGTVIDCTVVDVAVLEMAANGTALDVGQASLVRQMCTSAAR